MKYNKKKIHANDDWTQSLEFLKNLSIRIYFISNTFYGLYLYFYPKLNKLTIHEFSKNQITNEILHMCNIC